MWELDDKTGWALKNWCFWTVVLEKTLESPLDCKEIQPVHPKRNQPWIFIGRTEAKAPILCPPDVKNWLTGKDPNAGKDSRRGEKGTTDDEMRVSLTGWTWVWASSRSWWWTGTPGVLQSMGLQRVRHDWVNNFLTRKPTSRNPSFRNTCSNPVLCLDLISKMGEIAPVGWSED